MATKLCHNARLNLGGSTAVTDLSYDVRIRSSMLSVWFLRYSRKTESQKCRVPATLGGCRVQLGLALSRTKFGGHPEPPFGSTRPKADSDTASKCINICRPRRRLYQQHMQCALTLSPRKQVSTSWATSAVTVTNILTDTWQHQRP